MTLEERAVKARWWRWMPRMRYLYASDVPGGVAGGTMLPGVRGVDDHSAIIRPVTLGFGSYWPDLTDPATLGCLLALVRDAWGDPLLYAESWDRSPGNPGWVIQLPNETIAKGDTEAACLIAALESAP